MLDYKKGPVGLSRPSFELSANLNPQIIALQAIALPDLATDPNGPRRI